MEVTNAAPVGVAWGCRQRALVGLGAAPAGIHEAEVGGVGVVACVYSLAAGGASVVGMYALPALVWVCSPKPYTAPTGPG